MTLRNHPLRLIPVRPLRISQAGPIIHRQHRPKFLAMSNLTVRLHLRCRVICHRTNHPSLYNQARHQMILPVTPHRYRPIQVLLPAVNLLLNQLSLYNLLLMLPVIHLVTQPAMFHPFHFTHQLHRVISLLSVPFQV
jgi:hypothetical protein